MKTFEEETLKQKEMEFRSGELVAVAIIDRLIRLSGEIPFDIFADQNTIKKGVKMKNKNFDYHIVTYSSDYWIDYSEYSENNCCDHVIIDLSNEILSSICTANDLDFESVVAYSSKFISDETNGSKWLKSFADWCDDNINEKTCKLIDDD